MDHIKTSNGHKERRSKIFPGYMFTGLNSNFMMVVKFSCGLRRIITAITWTTQISNMFCSVGDAAVR
jgi:hypothetical protein